MSSSLLGAWSRDWWYCVYCLLSSIQTVYSQADSQTADGSDHSLRLSLHQSTWLHVHKVGLFWLEIVLHTLQILLDIFAHFG